MVFRIRWPRTVSVGDPTADDRPLIPVTDDGAVEIVIEREDIDRTDTRRERLSDERGEGVSGEDEMDAEFADRGIEIDRDSGFGPSVANGIVSISSSCHNSNFPRMLVKPFDLSKTLTATSDL